ncbi:SulP family inorganic anion transporter [Candidatus Binatus sp.]|uniref:SulP family inorganic anion transporter n=1 Tax=Candidatus Binatus sp. TaxID=2811406 RepID=UPI003BB0EB05
MDSPRPHSRRFSILPKWISAYEREWLRPDVVAGLTSSAVVIPKAMAYATIAGLPVEIGLYTAFVPPLIYAGLGMSRPLSVSTTTTLAILAATEFGQVAVSDPASLATTSATLTLLVGAILVLASLLRLGFVANFISEPVLVGFKAGIGLVIVFDQIPKILGIHFARGTFIDNLLSLFNGVPSTSPTTLLLGIVMIALLIGFELFAPRAPAPLIAVAIGIIGVSLLRLQDHGVELVGQIPQGLPSIVKPDLPLIKMLWPGALGIALMSFTETVAAGRAFTANGELQPEANRELLATGLANAAGAFVGCMPAGGGTTQTAVNRLAGARTQLSEIVMAGIALFTMLFLAPLIALMPQATLASVVIVYSIGLIRPSEFRAILNVRRTEFTWALAAFAGVVILGTLEGIVAAIAISLLALAYQNADPPVYELRRKPGTNVFRPRSPEHPEDEAFPGLLLLRLEGRVFFANAGLIGQKMNSLLDDAKPRVVAIDLSAVTDLEYTALKMLTAAEERQRKLGVSLWLVGLNPGVMQTVQRSALSHLRELDALQFNLELAVAKYQTSRSSAETTD